MWFELDLNGAPATPDGSPSTADPGPHLPPPRGHRERPDLAGRPAESRLAGASVRVRAALPLCEVRLADAADRLIKSVPPPPAKGRRWMAPPPQVAAPLRDRAGTPTDSHCPATRRTPLPPQRRRTHRPRNADGLHRTPFGPVSKASRAEDDAGAGRGETAGEARACPRTAGQRLTGHPSDDRRGAPEQSGPSSAAASRPAMTGGDRAGDRAGVIARIRQVRGRTADSDSATGDAESPPIDRLQHSKRE